MQLSQLNEELSRHPELREGLLQYLTEMDVRLQEDLLYDSAFTDRQVSILIGELRAIRDLRRSLDV